MLHVAWKLLVLWGWVCLHSVCRSPDFPLFLPRHFLYGDTDPRPNRDSASIFHLMGAQNEGRVGRWGGALIGILPSLPPLQAFERLAHV